MLIQRPCYPEKDGTCHSYVLHPPGGVAGGDSLDLKVALEPGARCLLTAPGATKVYRAPSEASRQQTTIDVGAGAVCELLPHEIILFNGARTRNSTDVRLATDSTFFGWDLVTLGRPAAGERFADGFFDQRTTITRDGRPVWFERAHVEGGSDILDAIYGFNGAPIFGTALYAGPLPEDAVGILRARTAPVAEGLSAITQVGEVMVCRFIGARVSTGRAFFRSAWEVLRDIGMRKPASAPRIWAT
jgi:urease accessory protein